MYGLSPQTDLSLSSGCTLTFVGFSQHQVQLGFSGDTDCSITIEGDYVVTPSGRGSSRFSGGVEGAMVLLPLLGHTVAMASVPTDGTERVAFANGALVEVL